MSEVYKADATQIKIQSLHTSSLYCGVYVQTTVNEHSAKLNKLAVHFKRIQEDGLACAFEVGWPKDMKQLLFASSRIDALHLYMVIF